MSASPPFIRVCSFSSQHGGDGTVEAGPDPAQESLSNAYGFSPVLSAPAPSRLEIWVPQEMPVRGFMGGSADYCEGVVFRVDGEMLGRVRPAYEITDEKWLSPGLHLLETEADGRHAGCHTQWGFGHSPWLEKEPEHYLAIGAVCPESHHRLTEWAAHHLATGVSHIYLLTRDTPDKLERAVGTAGLSGMVTVESFPDPQTDPAEAFRHLLRKRGPQCFWMALLETADWLIPKLSPDLPKILSAFEEYGGLLVPRVPPASAIADLPAAGAEDGGMFDRTKARPIVRPRFVAALPQGHSPVMRPGRALVGGRFGEELCGRDLEIRTGLPESCPSPACGNTHSPGMESGNHSLPRITGFIHVAVMKYWEAVLGLQLAKIQTSGLYDRTSAIYLGICGAWPGIESSSEILRNLPEKVKIAVLEPQLSRYEFPTLQCLQDHCQVHDGQVWYLHTKGVATSLPYQRPWRNRLEEFVIIHHELASAKLSQGYVTAAGQGSPDERWPIPGNFWWADCRHIRSLPPLETLDQTRRHEAERWIGLNGISRFYRHEDGDTRFRDWEITASQTKADPLTTSGHHGWIRLPVLPPEGVSAGHLISAHAPSVFELTCRVPLRVVPFTCRTAVKNDWRVEFLVNDHPAGTAEEPGWRGAEFRLPPGSHHLRANLAAGSAIGAHTCWGVSIGKEITDGIGKDKAAPCLVL